MPRFFLRSRPPVLFLLAAAAIVSAVTPPPPFLTADLADMTVDALRTYRENLSRILNRVEEQLENRTILEDPTIALLVHNMAKRDAATETAQTTEAIDVVETQNSSGLLWEVENGSGYGEEMDEAAAILNATTTQFTSEQQSTPEGPTEPPPTPFAMTYRYFPKQAVLKPHKSYRNTQTKCQQLSREELVDELKKKGTYNPDFMAWDVPGVIRFLEKATTNSYDKVPDEKADSKSEVVERNLAALERILKELNVDCNVRSQQVIDRLYNLTISSRERRSTFDGLGYYRAKREATDRERRRYLHGLYDFPSQQDDPLDSNDEETSTSPSSTPIVPKKDQQKPALQSPQIVGQVHVVPFGCQKRGSEEDGYLRLCGACQAIRRLPDDFFPPFINEILCDQDKACLYFYDYPHGKCKQKHMNFVVLRNVGTAECQVWRKFNINVRVSCECFVDQMSFFAKYV